MTKAGAVFGLPVGMVVAAWPLIALLAVVSTAYGQESTAPISGYVVSGTAGAGAPQDIQVLLHVFRENGGPEIRRAEVDSDGRFVFEEVAQKSVAGYTVSTTYLGIEYTVALTPEDDLASIRLSVYEVTTDLDNVSIAADFLLILGADAPEHSISLMEIVEVANLGDRVFVPGLAGDGPMNFLRFPLPSGASDLEVQTELPEGEVLQVDRGFALTTPVPPGEHGVAFTYTIPYDGAALDISRSFIGGVGTFRVLMPRDVGTVSSATLTDQGDTTIGDTTFRLLEVGEVPPAGFVEIVLQGLPQPSIWQRLQKSFGVPSWALAPAVLTLALLGLLIFGWRRRGLSAAVATGGQAQGRASLVEDIAALDDRFVRGEVDENTYRAQREALKVQLLRVAWREERTP